MPTSRLLRAWRFPIFETRNRVLAVVAERRNRGFQRDEIRRLEQLQGHRQRTRAVVVIPTFKRPERLVKAVQSALAQTFGDLTVIVVDDGGGLPELPADPRLVAVSLSRNSATLGLVRNVGINLTDSEYIAFLDDDNVWTPDHVAKAVDALDKNPALAAVYTSVRRLRPDGSQLDILGEPFDRRKLRHGDGVDANSIVVRRASSQLFSVLPRDKNTHPKEDWEFVWRLSRRGRIAYIPVVTVNYAVHPGSYFTKWGGADRSQSTTP